MIICQLLLVIFTWQWLYSQYNTQKDELKKNLTKIFTDVQHQISDSLLLSQVIDPVIATEQQNSSVDHDSLVGRRVALSPGGLHRILAQSSSISTAQEKKLFSIDTIVFNELFSNHLRQNGWSFQSQWINNNDSNKDAKSIFIKSDFFTQENGVVVRDYGSYLMVRMLPQFFFVLILLALTGAAFFIAFKSLEAQIKLSQMKDDFIGNMSHELKTPISTVKLALEALTNYGVLDNPAMSREYLGMATSEMDRLELLATRVLNTSLLENGKMHLQRESYDLRKLVQEVLQNLQLRFAQHGAQISFQASGSDFVVPIDKLHMQGVLVNLLDNSLKYATTATPHIYINLCEADGKVKLDLRDDGPGIPEEYKEKIFEKFFRVPNGLKHNIKGYGLGLSYAAQVMKQHNGSIGVQNVATGGCMFSLTF